VNFARTQGFEVQASEDLINWTTIGSNSVVVGTSTTFNDPDAGIYDNRFYRVISNQ